MRRTNMSVLTKAEELINGDRAAAYGNALDNHKNIADLWTAWLGWELTPEDVVVMMILLKVARLTDGYHEDSVTDIAGYAGVLERIKNVRDEREKEAKAAPTGGDYTLTVNGETQKFTHDGRRMWDNWFDIPKDTPVNSSDEADGTTPWWGEPDGGPFGEGPWREAKGR
jgi:hypothetical protein